MEKMEECSADDVEIENQESITEKYSAQANRIIVCIGIIVGSIWSGMAEDCARAVSTQLEEPISSDRANHFQAWATPSGIVCSYLLMKTWGRKKCLLMANTISFFACICLLFVRQKEIALAGCVLIWFSRTAYITAVRVYASEVTSPQLRGFLGVFICLAVVSGSLLNLTFRILAEGRYGVRACFSMSILSLTLTSYKKESPFWLHHQTRTDEARKAFLWIRGDDSSSENELKTILATEPNPKAKIFITQFFNAFITVACLMLVKITSDQHLLNQLEMKTLQADLSANSNFCSLFLDSLRIFSSAILCLLILKVRRRSLFFVSAAGSLISLFSWSYVKTFSQSLEMNLLSLVIFHNIFVFMGVSQIPWILATEIFPNQSRDAGFCCCSLFFVLFDKFIHCEETIFTYWLHFILMLLSCIASYFIMPETLGITLQAAENNMSTKLLMFFTI